MNRFEREYQSLNKEQRSAVDTIDGPLLVVAGPGTGKTQLLSLRVANILKKTDANPYNILCLTYTESGKEAMVQRLNNFIGKAAKKVEIHTFHGFGTRLINRFPDFFPELVHFRPAEDLTLYEALHECFEKLPRKNPLSRQAYGQFIYQADARDRISQFKRAGIAATTVKDLAKADLAWSRQFGAKLAKNFNQAGRLSINVVNKLVTDMETLLNEEQSTELGKLCIEELNQALNESQQSGKTSAVSTFKRKWFTSEDGQLYFKPTDQIKKLMALGELYDAYEKELKKRRIYDYDDMILFALEKLKQNREFKSQVQESFQYILADEYQDTNAAQASIINLIADNRVNEGRPNVMVVGDDDQAIYGFQGAMGDVLMDFRERWRDVKVIILKDNYRSTKSILSTARTIITQGQQRLENNYEDIDKSLNSRSRQADIEPHLFETSSAESVLDKAVQSAKSANPDSQLAVIATKHKYLLELADKLDIAKVKYYYEGHENLLNDPGMAELLLLADCILAIKQKYYDRTSFVLPEIIATGQLKIPKNLAWQIALKAKNNRSSWWQAMKILKQKEIQFAVDNLKGLADGLDSQDAVDSLKQIAQEFGLRVVQRVYQLNKHAATYFGHKDISLSDILRYSELCRQAGVSLDYKIVKGKQQAPVVLLSAHKSKGLEFDRVYLLHADYHTWFKEGGRRNNLVLPPNWQTVEPIKSNNDDRLRLLYVVMTRAKNELGFIKSQTGQSIPGLENLKSEAYVFEQLEVFNLPSDKTWRYWYMPVDAQEKAKLKKLLQDTMKSYHLSSTHLTTFLDIVHDGPTMVLTRILLGIPEPVHPEAVFGNLVHRSLKFAQEYLNNHGLLPKEKEIEDFIKSDSNLKNNAFAADVIQVISDYLKHDNILSKGGVSEFSFGPLNIKLDEMPLTGTIDHYKIADNILIITDFKTGRALNSWHVTEDYYKQKLHRFRQQLLFYELLFELSSSFEYNSAVSKVVFVEPSRRDVYYQLTLDANLKERQALNDLIAVVWQKITNLDFPNVSQYSQDAIGIQKFESDLISRRI